MNRFYIGVGISLLVDQLSKLIATSFGLVQFNPGISFGLFSGNLTLAFLGLFLCIFYFWTRHNWQQKFPAMTGVVIGAALSNFLDRIFYSGVRDFLPVPFLNLKNNLADWLIVGGLLLLAAKENYGHKNT